LADIYARPVMNVLREWKLGNRQLREDDWTRYRENVTTALSLDPTNPDIHQLFGKVTEGPYQKVGLGKKEAACPRQMVAEHYRRSIELRPTWPYGYIDLALVKYRLLEIDDEFYNAMHASLEYGPWGPDIQRVVSEIGMVLWNIMDNQEREFILEVTRKSFRHANQSHVRTMKKIIENRKFVARVCRQSEHNV